MVWLADMAYKWYLVLSQVSAQVGEPIQRLLGSQSIPAVSALLLGLLGGLAPCQVTANAGAIAYVTQENQGRSRLWRTMRDFLGGKVVVYVLLGFLAAVLGFRLPPAAMALLRKLTGPLMILIGLYMAGVLRWRSDLGTRVKAWIQEHMPRRGSPPFWLGVACSLGFCPTMAVIFFGALVPMIIQDRGGLVLPVIFAIGTVVPVILWALALAAGRGAASRWIRRARHTDRYVRWIAAAVLLILGLNDTILYWFV